MRARVLLLTGISLLVLCGAHHGEGKPHKGPVVGCEAKGNARPICKFQSPEDLVALPGNEAILVSEYGAMEGNKPGALALLVIATDARKQLFKGGDADGSKASWGDPACPGPPPPLFSPHGIHLSKRDDGALQLLVVQHGGRESIEYFEVTGSGTSWQVAWRGCVVAPDNAWLNSVAALPGGGFVTTNMMPRMPSGEDLAAAFQRGETLGYALVWEPGQGFSKLGGSDSIMPNGVETTPDGKLVFLNSSGNGEVRRIERATGKVQAIAKVDGLDNARWASDGRLVVASVGGHGDPADFELCMSLETGACPIEFKIVAIDPESMRTEVLYQNQGPPMGGGTVGLVIGKDLFIGSFSGDRILRVALD